MATRYDFSIDQGSDTSIPVRLLDAEGTALDLTGATAEMQLRRTPVCESAADELSTENGRIEISGDTATIIFPHQVTEKMAAGRYLYDLEVTLDGNVTRVLEGAITIRREITR